MSQSSCRPSPKELFEVWIAAVRGDDQAKRELFAIQMRHPETKKLLGKFAKKRAFDSKQKRKQLGLKSAKPQSDWQKAVSTATKSGATFVSGGLPSLGKK